MIEKQRKRRGTEGAWLADPLCYREAVAEMVISMLAISPAGLSLESVEALERDIKARFGPTRSP